MNHALQNSSCLKWENRNLKHSGEARNSTSIASDDLTGADNCHCSKKGSSARTDTAITPDDTILVDNEFRTLWSDPQNKNKSDHFLTMNPAVCTWRLESNAITLTFALGNSLLQASISRITSFGSVHPNIGNLYNDQYLLS